MDAGLDSCVGGAHSMACGEELQSSLHQQIRAFLAGGSTTSLLENKSVVDQKKSVKLQAVN